MSDEDQLWSSLDVARIVGIGVRKVAQTMSDAGVRPVDLVETIEQRVRRGLPIRHLIPTRGPNWYRADDVVRGLAQRPGQGNHLPRVIRLDGRRYTAREIRSAFGTEYTGGRSRTMKIINWRQLLSDHDPNQLRGERVSLTLMKGEHHGKIVISLGLEPYKDLIAANIAATVDAAAASQEE